MKKINIVLTLISFSLFITSCPAHSNAVSRTPSFEAVGSTDASSKSSAISSSFPPNEKTSEYTNSNVDGIATPNSMFEPQINSKGHFTITFQSNQKLPCVIGSDKFTITSTSCRINMDVENLLPDESLNDENVYLTLHGPGCGWLGKRISYEIDGGELGYTFTGLTKGAEYYFDVEMWDWVDTTGNITNFGGVVD